MQHSQSETLRPYYAVAIQEVSFICDGESRGHKLPRGWPCGAGISVSIIRSLPSWLRREPEENNSEKIQNVASTEWVGIQLYCKQKCKNKVSKILCVHSKIHWYIHVSLWWEVWLHYVQTIDEQKTLHACHVDLTAGQLGRVKTLYRIKEQFMWCGMYIDILKLAVCLTTIHNFCGTLSSSNSWEECTQRKLILQYRLHSFTHHNFLQYSCRSVTYVCQHVNRKLTWQLAPHSPLLWSRHGTWWGLILWDPSHQRLVMGVGISWRLPIINFTKWAEALPTTYKSTASTSIALFKVHVHYAWALCTCRGIVNVSFLYPFSLTI